MKTAIPERRWLVDGIEFPDHAIIELARDYGYGGDDPARAAVALRAWHYQVKELRKQKCHCGKPLNEDGLCYCCDPISTCWPQ